MFIACDTRPQISTGRTHTSFFSRSRTRPSTCNHPCAGYSPRDTRTCRGFCGVAAAARNEIRNDAVYIGFRRANCASDSDGKAGRLPDSAAREKSPPAGVRSASRRRRRFGWILLRRSRIYGERSVNRDVNIFLFFTKKLIYVSSDIASVTRRCDAISSRRTVIYLRWMWQSDFPLSALRYFE